MAGERNKQYERIIAVYGRALARLAACYEKRPHAREDLLQEILLAIWKALPGFRGDCSEQTFVFRVAHNRCLSHAWRRGQRAEAEDEMPEVADARRNPEEQVIDKRRREALLEAIRRLALPYRQVVMLALEDLPVADIAAVLGITENTAGVRLNRARKMLRAMLEKVRS